MLGVPLLNTFPNPLAAGAIIPPIPAIPASSSAFPVRSSYPVVAPYAAPPMAFLITDGSRPLAVRNSTTAGAFLAMAGILLAALPSPPDMYAKAIGGTALPTLNAKSSCFGIALLALTPSILNKPVDISPISCPAPKVAL